MKPLTQGEIVERETYAGLRDTYRAAVIEYKRGRRLAVGENVTLLFEDRETLRFQIQEMLWVEGIEDPKRIQYELDTYNELMPGDRELSATLFIEITEMAEIKPALQRMLGVDEHVCLVLGVGAGEERIAARFDPGQMEEDRISAVQYIRFELDADQQARFCDRSLAAHVRVDHPNYAREVEIPPETRQSLIDGLLGDPGSLLPSAGAAPRRAPQTAFETPALRAVRPAHPAAPGHIVIEPIMPVTSLLDVGPELLTELLEGVKRAAAEVVADHGMCRVHTDIGGETQWLRWHVYAPPGTDRRE